MNSIWLNKHTDKVKELQNKDFEGKKKALIIVAIIFIALIGIIFAVGASDPNYDSKTSAMFIAIVGTIVIFVMFLTSKKSSNRDVTKRLCENLETILKTPEQISEFDNEMLGTPLCDFDGGAIQYGHIIFTEHYIGITYSNLNLPDYRFARRADISKMNFTVTKDETKPLGMGKAYIIDLIDSNGKKCLGTTVYGRERMDNFEETLKKYCPGIELQEHKLF